MLRREARDVAEGDGLAEDPLRGGLAVDVEQGVAAVELDDLHARLTAADYRYAKPGIESTPWGSRELRVTDPFGNRLIFFTDQAPPQEERP